MEQLDYNMLFRWFVGLPMDDRVWDHSSFTKNRERLIGSEIAAQFFGEIRGDGTLIEAWASQKSFLPKDEQGGPTSGGAAGARNPEIDFRGQKRANDPHESKTDPDARLAKKTPGSEARLTYMGHVIMENKNGLVVDSLLTISSGTAEDPRAFSPSSSLPCFPCRLML
jgi:hypothetical protein